MDKSIHQQPAADARPDRPDPGSTSSTPSAGPRDAKPRTNLVVLFGSAATVLGIAIVSLVAPEWASTVTSTVVAWVSDAFGWWYFALIAAMLVVVIVICFSRYGNYRLGPDDSRPDYNLFTWTAMLFAAGIGTDVIFYSVAEPVAQYLHPPAGEGGTPEAAREAVTWMLFHYGLSGWALYALIGMALGFFAFRRGLPLAIRSALYPIFGKRIQGRTGDTVDIATVVGTIFGVATSLGIGIALLSVGFSRWLGVSTGTSLQIALIVASVVLATTSAVSGVDKGIRRLSELNVLLSVSLLGYILISGDSAFLFNALVMNLGDYLSQLPGMSFDTLAYRQAEGATLAGDPDTTVTAWMNLWTLFFWAWWIAWAPFVGMFLARISRGRTIRQFILGVMSIPFVYILLWGSVIGNSAIRTVRNGDETLGENTYADPASGFYDFIEQYAGAGILIALVTITGFLFYVTSADSGALVTGNLTSKLPHPMADCAVPVRIFWSVTIGLLTFAMLTVGGENWLVQLTNITVIMSLPFSFVLALIAVGLIKAFRQEARDREAKRAAQELARGPGSGDGAAAVNSGEASAADPAVSQEG